MTTVYHEGRIKQEPVGVVASVSALDEETMLRHLHHYAAQYADEGPLRLEVKRTGGRWRKLAV